MKPINRIQRFLGTLILAVTTLGAQATPNLVPPTETYAGKTHSQWLDSWFIWMFSVPGNADDFPFLDTTGANSGANQSGPVFFTTKSWAGKKGNPPEQRTATVPEGTALFLPFDGYYIDPKPERDPATIAAENRAALEAWKSVFKLVVDGQEVPVDSSLTSPLLHETSVFSLPVPANAAARSVGFSDLPASVYPFHSLEWFALLKPLPVGQHVVHVSNNGFIGTPNEWVTDIVWNINVVAQTLTNPPVIIRNPVELQRNLGEEAVFSVNATGTDPLTYQWQKDGTPLAGQTAPILQLTNLTAADAGNYSVIVTNPNGSVTSSAAMLTVNTVATRLLRYNPIGSQVSGVPLAPSFIHTNAVGSELSQVGLEADWNNNDKWPVGRISSSETITLEEYVTFTITPLSGKTIRVQHLSFSKMSYGGLGGGGIASIRSSLDSFSADIQTVKMKEQAFTAQTLRFDLSSLPTISEPVEFRLYFYGASVDRQDWVDLAGSTSGGIGLQLNGWFATPVPVRLSIVAPTHGSLVIRADGSKGSKTVLEGSPDFVKWTAVKTNLTLPFEYIVPDSTETKAQFYRVSTIP